MNYVFVQKDSKERTHQVLDTNAAPKTPLGQHVLRVIAAAFWLLSSFKVPIKIWGT